MSFFSSFRTFDTKGLVKILYRGNGS